ncbi:hypothetical protein M2212_003119 [Bradyrhizobium elkanii]|nr:hypothetical protein [Bradyrhizobium elkanii]MCS3686656.1 hypothetical protein [Bradyrhizobium elkanii]
MVILRQPARLLATLALALAVAPPALVLPMRAMAESRYPTPTRDGRERIQRTGSCPTGYVGKGDFCEALHAVTPRAYPVIPGKACPSGTFRSGNACKAFR